MLRVAFAGLLVVMSLVVVLAWEGRDRDALSGFDLTGVEATAMLDPGCGCCGEHIEYMEATGARVEPEPTGELIAIKDSLGIPADMRSCHTTLVDGYVVEGHMPAEVIQKLLDEKPDILGIALPAMPSGSPGMPGQKDERWTIYALEHDGSVSVFMEI